MLTFNNRILRYGKLQPPLLAFDPDLKKIRFLSRDTDTESVQYTLNSVDNTLSTNTTADYSLPEIDKEYFLQCKSISSLYSPSNIKEYKIFMNHERCNDFLYASYSSGEIDRYIGTNSNIFIPDKHNLVNTTDAHLEEYPNISNKKLTLTAGRYLQRLYINEVNGLKYTSISINSPEFLPREAQFKDFNELESLSLASYLKYIPTEMLYNNTALYLPSDFFKDVSSVGVRALYNTPKIKIIRLKADTLQQSSFDGAGEKVIFTSADTINGLDQKTLTSNTALPYTGGKHQVYCGLNELDWTGESATDNIVNVLGYNNGSSIIIKDGLSIYPKCIGFKANKNVLGFFVKITSSNGSTKLSGMYYLPKNYSTGNNQDAVHNDFYTSGNYKYFMVSAAQMYGTEIVTNTDRLTIQPIDMNGLSKNVYTYTIMGADISVEPTEPIKKVVYTGGLKEATINIDNGAYTRDLVSTSPMYYLYLVLDSNYPNIMFRLLNSTGDAYYNFSTSGSYEVTKYHDFTDDEYISVSGKRVYILELNDFIPKDKISNVLSSYPTLRAYYNGYSTPVYDLPLTRKLSGSTSSN